MKFAKELEQEHVPEWRVKYLNYKLGKKYVKGVARAIHRVNATPKASGWKNDIPPPPPQGNPPNLRSPLLHQRVSRNETQHASEDVNPPALSPTPSGQPVASEPTNSTSPDSKRSPNSPKGIETNYGSFARTPPIGSRLSCMESRQTFELPDPAMYLPPAMDNKPGVSGVSSSESPRGVLQRGMTVGGVDTFKQPHTTASPRPGTQSQEPPATERLRRLFSHGPQLQRVGTANSIYPLQAMDLVKQREREFFDFLDIELEKVEAFYRQKEDQAELRLNALREQLHEMRDRRAQEIAEIRRHKEQRENGDDDDDTNLPNFDGHRKWIEPIKAKIFKPGANSKRFAGMQQTPRTEAMSRDATRDYMRRPEEPDVSYRTAKRKLKLALQEFYRGLELLKSYVLLNRTAFRKLNKKYDKAVNARPAYRYMNEKVNKARFVNSEVIDEQIKAVEDLYARYFEKGNQKIAAGKLRRINRRPSDESGIAFWNGLATGIGAVFSIQGLVYGTELLFDSDPTIRSQTSYLLQIYAGYFLILLLFSLFCLNCYFWTASKINYPFIFEFDPRHHLDWRQLASFPSMFLLLFGVFFWLNFTRYGHAALWLYYPVILIVISLLIIFFPARILWHRSRHWLAYSHFRLFFAGLYPVEFRDFFLGDMYCSLTYATSNVELFFCLYANYWENPIMCSSRRSRLLGFFATLPAIWRALQCIRRYYDTKSVFPHLVNCGKYTMTILSMVTLSLYRIERTHTNLALFITFSTINGIYTSVWDLFMDFSLLQPDTRHPFLRDILGLKRRWVYYVIMVVDPILRFGWIFYAIFTHNLQHSTIVSFGVALSEVIRRGMWSLLRVENEHCGNVAQYKASRDVPLPYDIPHEPLIERTSTDERPQQPSRKPSNVGVDRATNKDQVHPDGQPSAYAPSPVVESGLRRRGRAGTAGAKSIRGIMANAHRQDFVKKKRPAVGVDEDLAAESADEIRTDDDEDDDTRSMAGERFELRRTGTFLVKEESEEDEH